MSTCECVSQTTGKKCQLPKSKKKGDNPKFCSRYHQNCTKLWEISKIIENKNVEKKQIKQQKELAKIQQKDIEQRLEQQRTQRLEEVRKQQFRQKKEQQLEKKITQIKQNGQQLEKPVPPIKQKKESQNVEKTITQIKQNKQQLEKPVSPIKQKKESQNVEKTITRIKQNGQQLEKTSTHVKKKRKEHVKQKDEKILKKIITKREELKNKIQENENYVRDKLQNKNIVMNDCGELGGFINVYYSCYFDSALYSLLHQKNKFIDDNILLVNTETLQITGTQYNLKDYPILLKITNNIQSLLNLAQKIIFSGEKTYSYAIRKAFAEYDEEYKKTFKAKVEGETKVNWKTEQLEALDVILKIISIFNIPQNSKMLNETHYLNTGGKNEQISDIGCNFRISHDSFTDFKKDGKPSEKEGLFQVKDLLKDKVYIEDSNQVKSETLIESTFLFIHLGRVVVYNPKNSVIPVRLKVHTEIYPNLYIKFKDNVHLNLISIIVHKGAVNSGHYYAYINCGENWYLYNDSGFNELKLIGTYNDLFEYDENILSNATDFVYA